MTINDCKLITLPKITDPRGNLSFVEGGNHIPFEIRRVFYLYDVPGGSYRGAHAHKTLEQVIIAVSGAFDVVLEDGEASQTFHLDRSHHALYVPAMTWSYLDNFTTAAVCLVLASDRYEEADYIRDHDAFLAAIENQRGDAVDKHGAS